MKLNLIQIIIIGLVLIVLIAITIIFYWRNYTVKGNIHQLKKIDRWVKSPDNILTVIRRIKDFGDDKAIDPLIWSFENAYFRNYYIPIIEALTNISDSRVIPSFIRLIGSMRWDSMEACRKIIESLKQIGATKEQLGEVYLLIIDKHGFINYFRDEIFNAVEDKIIDEGAVKSIVIRELKSRVIQKVDEWEIYIDILLRLNVTKEEIAYEFIQILNASTNYTEGYHEILERYRIIQFLGYLREKQAIDSIIKSCKYASDHFWHDDLGNDYSFDEFELAISTLEKLGATKAQINDAHFNAIENPNKGIREKAYEFPVSFGDSRALEPLMQEGLKPSGHGYRILHIPDYYFEALEILGATKEQMIEVTIECAVTSSSYDSNRTACIEKFITLVPYL